MYYVLTLQGTMVTGVHQNALPFSDAPFANSQWHRDDEVVVIDGPGEYTEGTDIRAYNEEGMIEDMVWAIEQGYVAMPEGHEIIDGELVPTEVTEEEAPATLKSRLAVVEEKAEGAAVAASTFGLTGKAAKVMFRALAANDTLTANDAAENPQMFPEWADCVGQRAEEGHYFLHNGLLYRVNRGQGHTIQANWPPDQAASLFSLAANPAEEWPEWIQPTGAHNAYAKGDKVTHGGKRWVSTDDANTWAPGVYGWEEVK